MAVYTITLQDRASAAAAQVQQSLSRVAVTANATASAFRIGGKAERAFARDAEKLARVELKGAKALDMQIRQLQKLDRTASKMRGFSKLTRGFSGLRAAGAAFVGGFLVRGLAMQGRSLLEAAGKAETYRNAVTRITKDATAPKRFDEMIKGLSLDLSGGREAVRDLLPSFDEETVKSILRMSSALSLTSESIKSVGRAFSQIAGKGKFQAEEFNQLADAGFKFSRADFYEAVSKDLGITPAEAQKIYESGKLPAAIGIAAARTAALKLNNLGGEGQLQTEIDKRGQSTAGRLASLDSSVISFKETVGAALIEAGALDGLAALTRAFNAIATANPKALAQDVSKAFKVMGVAAVIGTGLMIAFNFAAVAAGAAAAAAWVAAALPVVAVVAAVGLLSYAIVDLWDTVGGWQGVKAGLNAAWDWVTGWFGKFAQAHIDVAVAAFSWGTEIVNGLVNGITAGASRAIDAMTSLAAGVIDGAKGVFGIQSPAKAFVEQGKYIDEGLAIGIDDHADMAFSSATDLAEGAIMAAEMGGDASKDAGRLNNIGTAAGNAMNSSTANSSGGARSISVGPFNIDASGAKDGSDVVDSLRAYFDTEFAAMLEREMEALGA